MADYTREDVLRYRVHAQQLDRPLVEDRSMTYAAILDLGLQSTADGAGWSLRNRGVPVRSQAELDGCDDLALVWTLRGAPHLYRRADLPGVQVAVSPFSDADAGKRFYDASKPLRAAGVSPSDAMAEIGRQMRALVTRPMAKGDVSGTLSRTLGPEHLRWCRPCQATHLWEMPFRLAPLHAGLELVPGTSPPVIRRIPGWSRRTIGVALDPTAAPAHLQVIRGYLRLLGPATPKEVAGFLDAPVADVKSHWPTDAVPVTVDGEQAWSLADALPEPPVEAGEGVRLLAPFDLFLQARDRARLLDPALHPQLWPVLGRPGGILADARVVGTWRPRAAGKKLAVRVDFFDPAPTFLRDAVAEQARELAAYRGLSFAGLDG